MPRMKVHSVRLTDKEWARVTRLAAKVTTRVGFARISYSDVMRTALVMGLRILEEREK